MNPTSDPTYTTSDPPADQRQGRQVVAPLIRAAALVDFPGLVRELGSDPGPLLSGVGMASADLQDPERLIPAVAVDQLLTDGASATDCPHFGLLLARRHDLSTYLGTLGRAMWAAGDLGTALTRFTSHIDSHAQGSRWTLDVDGELARLRNDVAGASSIQASAHNLGLLARLLRSVTASRAVPSLVYFRRQEPATASQFRVLFGCPVVFDQEVNALILHAADLQLSIPTADPQLSGILLRHHDLFRTNPEQDLLTEVTSLIERNLLAGVTSVDAVARFLPFSRSTLQQRLADQGTSHQQLLDQVRDRWAKDRLRLSSIAIAELAHTLGFANADTFSAAFKRRNGMAPSLWRRQLGPDRAWR